MPSLNHYRFDSRWTIAHPAALVFPALVDLANWPMWWPDVWSVDRIDDDTAELLVKAVLPYRLVMRLHRLEENESAGRLRVAITGDLDGWCTGQVTPTGQDSTLLRITQEVEVTKPLLRALAPVARPVLRGNHAAMMWRGQRGLRRYLAGGRLYPA